MKRNDLDKKIYSNINISEEMKETLKSDVKAKKRTADIRFRYSTALVALVVAAVVGFGGFGVSAAYISYKNRIAEMSEEEQVDYEEELATDTYNTGDEAMTRALTDAEYDRYMALEDEYYVNGRFPENSLKYVDTLDEISEDELAFVKEINKIHVPEAELSDEQLLQLIDHMAKYLYTMEQNSQATETDSETAEKTEEVKEAEAFEGDEPETIFDVSSDEEAVLKARSIELVKEFYGVDIDDSWDFLIYEFRLSEMKDYDESDDEYEIMITESDAPNATMYQISIPVNEDGRFEIHASGKDYYTGVKQYSQEEAKQFFDKGQEQVLKLIDEKFGLTDPDEITIGGFENSIGEPITSSEILYRLQYGDKKITVLWNITNEQVYTVMGKGII